VSAVAVCLLAATPALAATDIAIAPHRAAYTLELVAADSASGITEVRGGMTFEWADGCDGWSIDQRYLLRIAHENGSETVLRLTNLNWESKDGKRFRFRVKNIRDGVVEEDLRGRAHLDDDGGEAVFMRPEGMKIALPADTRFPIAFTLDLMRAARDGVRMRRNVVFEGAIEGPQPVNTVILPPRAARDSDILQPPLGPQPVWPMFIAYFPANDRGGAPEAEISMDMQPNGIVPAFTLDYGSFKLRGVLARLVALEKPDC